MPHDDCLFIRLGPFLEQRRRPPPLADTAAVPPAPTDEGEDVAAAGEPERR